MLSPGQSAHHIVEFSNNAAVASRAILDSFGIGINDISNGVGLSKHAGRHTNLYSNLIANRLAGARTKKSAEGILRGISRELSIVDREISLGVRSDRSVTGGWASDVNAGRNFGVSGSLSPAANTAIKSGTGGLY